MSTNVIPKKKWPRLVGVLTTVKKHPLALLISLIATVVVGAAAVIKAFEPIVRLIDDWFPNTEQLCSSTGRYEFIGSGEQKTYNDIQSFNLVRVVGGGTLSIKDGGGLIANRIVIEGGGMITGTALRVVAGKIEGGGTLKVENGGQIDLVADSIAGVSIVADGSKGGRGSPGSFSITMRGLRPTPRTTPPGDGNPGKKGGSINAFIRNQSGVTFSVKGGEGGDGGDGAPALGKDGKKGPKGGDGVLELFKSENLLQVFQLDDLQQTLIRAKELKHVESSSEKNN